MAYQVLLLIWLASCASYTQEARQEVRNYDRMSQIETRLKVGQSLDQVRALAPELGNCSGSVKTLYVCELQYKTGSDYTIGYDQTSQEHFKVFKLDFENGRLARWYKSSENVRRQTFGPPDAATASGFEPFGR